MIKFSIFLKSNRLVEMHLAMRRASGAPKLLLAPGAFKGSFSALELLETMKNAVVRSWPEVQITCIPIADGGDDTLAAIESAVPTRSHRLVVPGPLHEPIDSRWLSIDEELAIIELASASGIALLKGRVLQAMKAQTIGCGMLLRNALQCGFKKIVLTVGGSASTDGGTGVLHALGARFYSSQNAELDPGGDNLHKIARIDLSELDNWRNKCEIVVATDVTNPLTGKNGTVSIFSRQKGATAEDAILLEQGMINFASLLESATGRQGSDLAGAGAAGGVPFALYCAMSAEIISGFSWLSRILDLEHHVNDCIMAISSEGRLDSQSLAGKHVGALAELCLKHNTILGIIAGDVEPDFDWAGAGIYKAIKAATPGAKAEMPDIERSTQELVRAFNELYLRSGM